MALSIYGEFGWIYLKTYKLRIQQCSCLHTSEKRKQNDIVPSSVGAAQPLLPASSSSNSSHYSFGSDTSFDNKRLNPIDVLLVDKQSRLTLTKKVKRVIPLNPEDKVMVYQDIYNKDIVLKVQYHKKQHQEEGGGGDEEEEKKLENWVLTIRKEVDNTNGKKTTVDSENNSGNPAVNYNEDGYCSDGFERQPSNKYKFKNREKTLYSTPILLVDDNSDLLFAFIYC